MNGSIQITAVEKKREGLSSDLRPWTLWHIHSENGLTYRTFDGVLAHRAFEAVGERAAISYEHGKFGPELLSLAIEREAA